METSFTQLVQVKFPIVLAPMAGGPSTPELTAAVSEVGGLGSHGVNYLSPEAIRSDIQKIKSLTNKPFAVNLFIPSAVKNPADKEVQAMLDFTNEIRRKLGANPLVEIPPTKNNFSEQVEVLLQEAPPVFSFVFGLLEPSLISEFKKRSIRLLGTASSVDEAEQLQASGVDAICLQGFEGGGHRGVFADHTDAEIPLRTLLQSVSGKIKIPFIAAGGLMTGQDIKEVLKAGASAAQLGTA
ncbi:MAG TPA: nitronate monooxygenase, partial [Bdellovibrio sp.]|nr:nitronate monooxygenase [Bdellovibrio sp.]